MIRSGKGYKRAFHLKDMPVRDPEVRRLGKWSQENRGFYNEFRKWLFETGYSKSSVHRCGVVARQSIGYLDKPYWTIDPDADIERVQAHFYSRKLTPGTKEYYRSGLLKLAEYLRFRQNKPPKTPTIRWEYYLGELPDWLCAEIRVFLLHCKRTWKPDRQHPKIIATLSELTRCLRWMHQVAPIEQLADLTPERWYDYLDYRLGQGLKTVTVNDELYHLHHFLHFVEERGAVICQRMLRVEKLEENRPLPRDIPAEELTRLQQAIVAEMAVSSPIWRQRLGKMDLAWFLLMLHSGLRTCEVRALKLADMDWANQRARIEQSKGLKDRLVFLSPATISALQDYLQVRGQADSLPDHVFIFRHKPLSRFYCGQRLHTYGERCGVYATPHMLRHSCATLLLNSGAPVLAVQWLLGHRWVDTTLRYARLYDGTVAADYYRAMADVERRLALPEDRLEQPPALGQLLALVDALHTGTLNAEQAELVRLLRSGLAALAEKEFQDVKVPSN
jgi:integrase/recombinase XerD